jgi:RES domain-containing protein
MMVLSFMEEALSIRQVQLEELPDNWRSMYEVSALQEIGASWYDAKETLVLKVPSVVMPQEFNFVINTEHPLFSEHVRLASSEMHFWEKRKL